MRGRFFYKPSKTWHGRYELYFVSAKAMDAARDMIQDDFMWQSDDRVGYDSLATQEQLTMLLLCWEGTDLDK